jgi:acyl-CoA synthetase (NDP forming)
VATAIVEAAGTLGGNLPLLSVFMSSRGVPRELRTAGMRIPSFAFPEAAAIALAHAARYAEWRQRPPSAPPHLEGLRRDEAAALVAEALGRGGGWLKPDEVVRLLDCYGLPLVDQGMATTAEEAAALADSLGGEVALKAIAADVLHKTELGAVRLGLEGAEAVRAAAGEMAQRLADAGHPPSGFLVQRMAPRGVEMLVGVVHDPQFGPVIACGAGGILVELLKDVSVRLTPLTATDAGEMVRALRSFPLLVGYRGAPASDVAALEDVLLRISALAEDLPQVAELDCNPLLVLPEGATIVDARIRVEPATPPRPLGARR